MSRMRRSRRQQRRNRLPGFETLESRRLLSADVSGKIDDLQPDLEATEPVTQVRLSEGNLIVEDASGDTNDQLTIRADGPNQRYVLISQSTTFELDTIAGAIGGGTDTASIPFASIAGTEVRFVTGGTSDELTVDFSLGAFPHTIDVSDSGGSNDTLNLTGATVTNLKYLHADATSGEVLVDSGRILHSGIESTLSSLTSGNAALQFSDLDETVGLAPSGTDQMSVGTTLGISHTIAIPTASLNIDAGDGTGDVLQVSGTHSLTNTDVELEAEETLISGDLTTTGTASISIRGQRFAQLLAGSLLSAEAGDITITGNQTPTPRGGAFVGVALNHATIQTRTGNLFLRGLGGSLPSATGNSGVQVIGGSQLETLSGNITITGTGGTGTANNMGVEIADSSVRTEHGLITLDGTGGTGSGAAQVGVSISDQAAIQSTGDSGESQGITLRGVSGAGSEDNRGVLVTGSSSVTTVSGDISIIGTGATQTDANRNNGIAMFSGRIESNGVGQDAGTITLQGTGGSGGERGVGVLLNGATNLIRSVDGNVSIIGTGGQGSGTTNTGVVFTGGPTVESVGGGASAATITIRGEGGSGSRLARGVYFTGSGANVRSTDGDILVDGTGGNGIDGFNQGVGFFGGAVESSGTGENAASISLVGRAGDGVDSNVGVWLSSEGTELSAIDGKISINGTAGNGTGDFNRGVNLSSGATIRSTGTTDSAQGIEITGTGGAGMLYNRGISVFSPETEITTVAGDISITGTAGGNNGGDFNEGVIFFDGLLESTGTGPGAGTITVIGTGGIGNSRTDGVVFSTSDTIVRSVDGDISVTGTGNGEDDLNSGVVVAGATVESTGTGDDAAAIRIDGTGGVGASSYGGVLSGSTSRLRTAGGDISILGTGTASTFSAVGVIFFGGVIESTGSGAGAGNIVVEGTGGNGINSNAGLEIRSAFGGITTVDGDISLLGTGNGSNFANSGVILSGGSITSTGTGPHAGNIAIEGTGSANGRDSNRGVHFNSSLFSVNAVDGDITIEGTGGGTTAVFGEGESNAGMELLGSITSTGVGAHAGVIRLIGQGGEGQLAENRGIHSSANITSSDGDIDIQGNGGRGSTKIDGIHFASGSVRGLGAANIHVMGVGGREGGDGVSFGAAIVETRSGDLKIVGNGSEPVSGPEYHGVRLSENATVGSALQTGTLTIAADTAFYEFGAAIEGSGELIIKPFDPADTIEIGTGGDLNLEIAPISSDFVSVTFGDPEEAEGPILVDHVSFPFPVTLAGSSAAIRQINANAEPRYPVTVIARTGTITGELGLDYNASETILDGDVMPGNSPFAPQRISRLTVQGGDLVLRDGSSLTIELGGAEPGETDTNHDQVDVRDGILRLGTGVSLVVESIDEYLPTIGQEFTIVSNRVQQTISGRFAGLDEGDLIAMNNGLAARISYVGGDGNDVTLQVIGPLDFGDAPEPFPTGYATGAAHLVVGPRLGNRRDSETDGQASENSNGDDTTGSDDEDGVFFQTIARDQPTGEILIDLQNQATARVDAWLDFDGDQIWQEDEQILDSVVVNDVGGPEALPFSINPDAILGEVHARIRVSTAGGLAPGGVAHDGEVEDYLVRLVQAPQVEAITINGGGEDRSTVTSAEIFFDGPVQVHPSAFRLIHRESGTTIDTLQVASESLPDGRTMTKLTFGTGGNLVENRIGGEHSLVDGNFELRINAFLVFRDGMVMRENFTFGAEAVDRFFRYFGDSDGDRDTDGLDYIRLAETFLRNSSNAVFDARFDVDGDDDVDGLDYVQFAQRFLRPLAF